jgi:hypothetical protein
MVSRQEIELFFIFQLGYASFSHLAMEEIEQKIFEKIDNGYG